MAEFVLSLFVPGLEVVLEELLERRNVLPEHVLEYATHGRGVSDHLQYTTVRPQRDHLVGTQQQVNILTLEDRVKLVDQLHSELFYINS